MLSRARTDSDADICVLNILCWATCDSDADICDAEHIVLMFVQG